jgi:hypothetical protein
MRSFIICTLHHILVGCSNQGGWAGHVVCMKEVRSTYEFSSDNLKGRENFEDLGIDGRIILRNM